MAQDPIPYIKGLSVAVRAGFFYSPEATQRPKEQPITWQIGPSDRSDLSVCVVTSRGNDHAQVHMSYKEAGKLALALMKAKGGQDL